MNTAVNTPKDEHCGDHAEFFNTVGSAVPTNNKHGMVRTAGVVSPA